MTEDKDNNNILPPTPLRKSRHSSILEVDTLPSINTPQGTKIYHPFLSHIMTNLDKQFTSPDMFNKNRVYPHRDSNTLSPDLIGNLFPKKINTNVEIQQQFEESLFRKYQSYFDKKSAEFFTVNIIKPSPEPHDSGIGYSLQLTETSTSDIVAPVPPIMCQTPPSKFRWNQEEHRSSFLIGSEMSFDDIDEPSNQISNQENLESTQLFTKEACLADNWSMRQQSVIGSPMFYEDKITSSLIESSLLSNSLRSSPHAKFNSVAMNFLNLSPIKCVSDEDMDTEEELL